MCIRDRGDNDQFLADQLQPAVLAEAARQKAWPMTLRIQPGYDHSYYFIASFIAVSYTHLQGNAG